jgi:phage tail sheath protein FI
MPEYLAPGLFVEEIDSGSKPIEGVGTNTAAFIGYAKSGEFNKPIFISNWTQFVNTYGQDETTIVTGLVKELGVSVGDIYSAQRTSKKPWPEFAFTLVKNAILDGKAKVKSFNEFVTKYEIDTSGSPYLEGAYLAHAVKGFYDNGGSRAYIVRVARGEDIQTLGTLASSNGTKAIDAKPEQKLLAIGPISVKPAKGAAAGDINIRIEHVGDKDEFKLIVTPGSGDAEVYPLGEKDPPLNLSTLEKRINGASKLIEVEVAKTATATRPVANSFVLSVADTANLPAKTTGGQLAPVEALRASGFAYIDADDFIGDEAKRTGFSGLSVLEDVNMVSVPDLFAGAFTRPSLPGGGGDIIPDEQLVLDDKRAKAILDMQCALVQYCEKSGDRIAILDAIPGQTPQEIKQISLGTSWGCDHGHAALYYPWVKIIDPDPKYKGKGAQKFVPPSGHIAGIYARVVNERGVHKAPANEVIAGAVALERDITKGEQETLNPDGVNCIRQFPGRGIRVWGARTLATLPNPSWKYVNVRRLFDYLESSIARSLQWAVFEPNDEDLWGRVRRTISAFLFTEWKEGKLFGTVPAEAYYVKCNHETNPQEMIDLGRMYVEIGVNPVKPAEFVIIRIGQWSSGSSVAEG